MSKLKFILEDSIKQSSLRYTQHFLRIVLLTMGIAIAILWSTFAKAIPILVLQGVGDNQRTVASGVLTDTLNEFRLSLLGTSSVDAKLAANGFKFKIGDKAAKDTLVFEGNWTLNLSQLMFKDAIAGDEITVNSSLTHNKPKLGAEFVYGNSVVGKIITGKELLLGVNPTRNVLRQPFKHTDGFIDQIVAGINATVIPTKNKLDFRQFQTWNFSILGRHIKGVVPEPSTLSLLFFSIFTLGFSRIRRKFFL